MAQSGQLPPDRDMTAARAVPRLAAVLLAAALATTTARADEAATVGEHTPGRGFQLGDTGFAVGGYFNLVGDKLDGAPGEVSIDDFSLFGHWEGDGRWRAFAEIDLEDALAWQPGRDRVAGNGYVALERLYADYAWSSALTFRAGKFLTPVGRWNVVHADPLVWTTSRPLVTERSFPTNVTGLMAYGTLPAFGRSLDLSVYSAVGQDWRTNPRLDPFEEAIGAHLGVPLDAASELGLSLVSFEQRGARTERRTLVGLDWQWRRDRVELSAEAAWRFSERGSRYDEGGAFVQAVAPLGERLFAVGRYEFFDPAGTTAPLDVWTGGLVLKPHPALLLKAEYRAGARNRALAPDGPLASVALLF